MEQTDFNQDFIQFDKNTTKNETIKLAIYFIFHITLYIVLFFFAIFFAWYVAFTFTHTFYQVSGVSMKSTLNSEVVDENGVQDGIYIDKNGTLCINDIIVIKTVDGYGKDINAVKRLLAFEDDYITIAKVENVFKFFRIPAGTVIDENFDENDFVVDETSGANGYQIYSETEWAHSSAIPLEVSVDGESKTRDYEVKFYNKFLSGLDVDGDDVFVAKSGLVFVKVPKNAIFYMGDNRAHSTDSREKGFLDRSKVVGRCEIIVENFNFGKRILEVIKFYFAQIEEFFAR